MRIEKTSGRIIWIGVADSNLKKEFIDIITPKVIFYTGYGRVAGDEKGWIFSQGKQF